MGGGDHCDLRVGPGSFLALQAWGLLDLEALRGFITMAHALGLAVVAEGVEMQEQRRILRELGCDYAQGYLLGRPMAPSLLAERVLSKPERVSLAAPGA